MYETMNGVIAEDITALDETHLLYESENEYSFIVNLDWNVTAQERDFAVLTMQRSIDVWWEGDPSEVLSEWVHIDLKMEGIDHQLFTLFHDYKQE